MAHHHPIHSACALTALLLLLACLPATKAYANCASRLYSNINLRGANLQQARTDPFVQGDHSDSVEECCYRCINTWDCAYFTRTPKGRCWLKGQVGWTIRPQADPCPDTTCTEGQEVTPLPSDAEDEAGPVPAADGSGGAATPSPSPNTGRRLRGQLQPTPPTPPASPAASPALAGNEEEEDPGVDGNTTNPSNTTSTTSSPPPTAPAAAAASPFPDANGPPAAASPSPVPGEGQDDSEEESPAPSVAACARWVSGAVNNHYVPGHDFACTIGQP